MILEQKYCLVCSKPMIKKSHESVNRYMGKKFCSQECSKHYMRENKIGWFNPEIQTIKRKDDSARRAYYRNEQIVDETDIT